MKMTKDKLITYPSNSLEELHNIKMFIDFYMYYPNYGVGWSKRRLKKYGKSFEAFFNIYVPDWSSNKKEFMVTLKGEFRCISSSWDSFDIHKINSKLENLYLVASRKMKISKLL